MKSNTGIEEREHWKTKILRALDELRDLDRGSAVRREAAPVMEEKQAE